MNYRKSDARIVFENAKLFFRQRDIITGRIERVIDQLVDSFVPDTTWLLLTAGFIDAAGAWPVADRKRIVALIGKEKYFRRTPYRFLDRLFDTD